MVSGLDLHEDNLAITHTTSSVLGSLLTSAQQSESTFQAARDGKAAAVDTLQAARNAGREFGVKARDSLRPFLGTQWNVSWAQAGFKNASLSVPASTAGVAELLRSLQAYYSANAAHQNTPLSLTGHTAGTLLGNLVSAVNTVTACVRDQRTKREARDAGENTLVQKMRAARNELGAVLSPFDPRWLDFVADIPADPQRPEPVANVTVQGAGPGRVFVDWEPSTRAERYPVEALVVAVDTSFQRRVTVYDTNTYIENLPGGATVQVRVVAANGAGEAPASPVVEAQVPAMAEAA